MTSLLRVCSILLLPAVIAARSLEAQCVLPPVTADAAGALSPLELLETGHYLRAARILEPLVAERPQDGQLAWLLSRARAALGDSDGAMKLAEAALAADNLNPAYHVQVAAVEGRIAERSSLFKRIAAATRAKKELDAAAALDPNNPDAQWGLMMFYYAAPPMLGGDKAKAQQIGEKLAAAVPDLGRYYQGRLAMELKESDKAESFFKSAILENPLLFEASAALARFYLDTKPDQARAEKWACQTVHSDPARADGWALLARVYTLCGCWTEALAVADRAQAIDPENLTAYYSIAAAASDRGEQLNMASTLLRLYMSKPAEGEEPSLGMAHFELGQTLEKLGRTADAVAEMKAALSEEPSLEQAKAALKRLESRR